MLLTAGYSNRMDAEGKPGRPLESWPRWATEKPPVGDSWRGTHVGNPAAFLSLGDLYDPSNPPPAGQTPDWHMGTRKSENKYPFSGDVYDPADAYGFIDIERRMMINRNAGVRYGPSGRQLAWSAFLLPYLEQQSRILSHMRAVGERLRDLPITISQGINTAAAGILVLKLISRTTSEEVIVEHRESGQQSPLEANIIRPIFGGRDIHRYAQPKVQNVCIYPCNQFGSLLSEETLRTQFPLAYEYLSAHRRVFAARRLGSGVPWFSLSSRNPAESLGHPKLISSIIPYGRGFSLDFKGSFLCKSGVLDNVRIVAHIEGQPLNW